MANSAFPTPQKASHRDINILTMCKCVTFEEEAAGFSTDCFSQRLRLPDTSPGLKSCIFKLMSENNNKKALVQVYLNLIKERLECDFFTRRVGDHLQMVNIILFIKYKSLLVYTCLNTKSSLAASICFFTDRLQCITFIPGSTMKSYFFKENIIL